MLLGIAGCKDTCVKTITAKPTVTSVQGGNATYGGEVGVTLQQCETTVFKAQWDAMNARKDTLNASYIAGKITKEIYDAEVKEINREIDVVLQNQTKSPKTTAPDVATAMSTATTTKKLRNISSRQLSQEQLAERINKVIKRIDRNLQEKGISPPQ